MAPRRKVGVWVAVLVVALALAAARVAGIAAGPPLLEIVSPFRYALPYGPSLFGKILLPPDRRIAHVRYVGDACESFLGKISVRDTAVLVDRCVLSFRHTPASFCQSALLTEVSGEQGTVQFCPESDARGASGCAGDASRQRQQRILHHDGAASLLPSSLCLSLAQLLPV